MIKAQSYNMCSSDNKLTLPPEKSLSFCEAFVQIFLIHSYSLFGYFGFFISNY